MPKSSSAEAFLLAAKRCERVSLEHLAETCSLVEAISRLVHQLQRERGLSNVFLASAGTRFQVQREQQQQVCQTEEQRLRARLLCPERVECPVTGGVRLYTRIACVLQALDGLPDLRCAISAQQLTPAAATQAFSRLVAGLLAVVFEAADAASDPEITRLLVALFNFMQGKEWAGQERAWAASGFAAGHFELTQQQTLQHLIEGQERCFEVFLQFAPSQAKALWQTQWQSEVQAEFVRLRQVVSRAQEQDPVPSAFSEVWYELATQRIDALREIEESLSCELLQVCEEKLQVAQEDLQNHHRVLARVNALGDYAEPVLDPLLALATPTPSAGVSREMERSIMDLLHSQAQRLQSISDELNEAREALRERKLIEKAKGLLMQHQHLSEEAAYRQLRKAAMEQNRRLADVAQSVVSLLDLLKV